MKKLLITCFFVLCMLLARPGSASALESSLDEILSDNRLRGASVAVHVVRLNDKRVIYSRNADRPLIPASNQKIVTAIAALDILGDDYEFLTTLWMSGRIQDDVLEGDLFIVGGADPTIGSPAIGEDPNAQFGRWARLLKGYGIASVAGDIIVDESMFDRSGVHPDWPSNQLSRHYSAPAGALSYHDNCVRVHVRPGTSVSDTAQITLFPPLSVFDTVNTCRTGSQSNIIRVERPEDSWQIRVSGEALHRTGGWSGLISVPDPALYTGKTFAHVLNQHGVAFQGEVIKKGVEEHDQTGDLLLLARRRAPLRKVLEVLLVESQNLYAENVLITIGAHKGETGSWQSGSEAVAAALKARGLAESDFAIADGSGYSRNNRITARAMSELLLQMYEESDSADFKHLLAEAGEQGTLADRLREHAYAGRVQAKSGYIAHVGALSGYARAASGQLLVFSIMINDFGRGSNWDMRQIQDSIVKALIDGL